MGNYDNNYRIYTENEWSLTKGKQHTRIGEVRVEEKVETEKSHYWKHKGYYLVVQEKVDHDFEGETLVWSKYFPAKFYHHKYKVKLESKEFRKRFHTYTTNQREARVCLKTNVMSSILDTFEPSRQIFMEFRNQWLIIGMEISNPLFEIDLNREYTYDDLIQNLHSIKYLEDLAEKLNINHEYLYKS